MSEMRADADAYATVGTIGYPWSWPPEVQARVERVVARAMEVFGNSVQVGVWESQFNPAIGPGQIRDAIKTEEGARLALAELDRLAATTVPRAAPDSGWVGKRRSRRRR